MRRIDDTGRFLSPEECERTARRVLELTKGGGDTTIVLSSWWTGELRWARNHTSLASDRRDILVTLVRQLVPGGWPGVASANQLDDVSLEATVRLAERLASLRSTGRAAPEFPLQPPTLPTPKTAIWSDATSRVTTEMRAQVAQVVTEGAEAKGMLSVGYMDVRAGQVMVLNRIGGREQSRYHQYTNAQCSMTVRHPKGTGSGWAGLTSYDWPKIDAGALAERALQKCLTSLNPVRIEPGRYTVILEPQAVYQLVAMMFIPSGRGYAEGVANNPFWLGRDPALGIGRSKLGTKVVDERVTISHEPTDPELGILPYKLSENEFQPITPFKFIDRGVLTALTYDRTYALTQLNENLGSVWSPGVPAFRMAGGDASIDEMIASTKRGLLVTRFSNVEEVYRPSLLFTGLTRDGLWLIENGKISKAVKNLRFTESPLFMLNQLEALGTPAPVFAGGDGPPTPAIVPPLKARDFSFTAMIDAI